MRQGTGNRSRRQARETRISGDQLLQVDRRESRFKKEAAREATCVPACFQQPAVQRRHCRHLASLPARLRFSISPLGRGSSAVVTREGRIYASWAVGSTRHGLDGPKISRVQYFFRPFSPGSPGSGPGGLGRSCGACGMWVCVDVSMWAHTPMAIGERGACLVLGKM